LNKADTAVLISGGGTNLQAFIDACARDEIALNLTVVFSNVASAYGLKRAEAAGIDAHTLSHKDYESREAFDRAVADILDPYAPKLIILAGFMRILSPWFVRHYEGRILNIHPALLPKYPGLDTHRRAIDAGDEWHGSSVHFVTEELDGGPCIAQGRLRIRDDDTPESLNTRVQSIEHQLYPQAADSVARGEIRYENGQAMRGNDKLTAPIVIDYHQ